MAEPEVGEHPPGLLDLPDEIYRQIARSLDDRSFCRLFASWRQSREVLLPDHTVRKDLRAILKKYGIDPSATKVDLGGRLGRTPLDVVVPALSTMPNLTDLYLEGNLIKDVAPLQSLTNLTESYLNQNQIVDVTPLQSLTNLQTLALALNQIKDVTPLQALLNLEVLILSGNQIEDVAPLQALTNLTTLWLGGNLIDDPAQRAVVQVLKDRGVNVSMY